MLSPPPPSIAMPSHAWLVTHGYAASFDHWGFQVMPVASPDFGIFNVPVDVHWPVITVLALCGMLSCIVGLVALWRTHNAPSYWRLGRGDRGRGGRGRANAGRSVPAGAPQ